MIHKVPRLAALMACALIAVSPFEALAKMVKETHTFTIKSGATTSDVWKTGTEGTIRLARFVNVTANSTVTGVSHNTDVGDIALATATASTTGTLSLTAFATVPICDETWFNVDVGSSTGSDRVYKLVLFIEK